MVKKLSVALITLTFLITAGVPVFAMENNSVEKRVEEARLKRQEELTKRKAELEATRARKAANAIARCEAIEGRISQRQTAHDANSAAVVRRFLAVHSRLTALSTRLTEAGLDTTKLNTDLDTFADLITAIETAYTVYSTSLETSEGYTCGKEEREFRSELTSTRRAFKAYRDAVREARLFLEQTIKPDLRDLKAQAQAAQTADEATN